MMTDSIGLLAVLVILVCVALAGCQVSSAMAGGDDYVGGAVTLDARALYGGFDARKVLLDEQAGRLVLDGRALKLRIKGTPGAGWIVTDPIDLRPRNGGVAQPADVASVKVDVAVDVPEGATAKVAVRSSANGLAADGWGDWQDLSGLVGAVDKLKGPFVQVRISLDAKSDAALPAVRSVVVTPSLKETPAAGGQVAVTSADVQQIVRSPIDFVYERPDQEDLAWFRREAKLDDVVAGAKGDFEKLVRLMDFVGGIHNDRTQKPHMDKGCYLWNVRKVISFANGKPTIYGHCMSYAEVLLTAASAMGYVGSRHNATEGFRDATHETTEIWVPDMGRWLYFDPSLTNYYFDKKTNEPMDILQMHDVITANFVPEGVDMIWFCQREQPAAQALVRKIGGKSVIGSRLGPWRYGEPMPEDYNWGWSHGYLAAGNIQMTPRNDFHSNPKAMSRKFQYEPGYSNYPNWVDAKTPPTRGAENWFTRKRDWYWTLDQATLSLGRTGQADTLNVLLGQSMPHFKEYRVTAGGKTQTVAADTFAWKLTPGENTLTVAPVDQLGKVGMASTVTVNYTK